MAGLSQTGIPQASFHLNPYPDVPRLLPEFHQFKENLSLPSAQIKVQMVYSSGFSASNSKP